ncbi:DUF4955 domain-containing protein [Aestuariivivens insulae]|uniref:DUF4955 domain-containing protein n=1 Tax=Aestuariivivens insulae TaxID=1621988 RepID=UPI001F59EBAC|nr:DUF4955 domain-containing protein [Aestuariivivens insulae]
MKKTIYAQYAIIVLLSLAFSQIKAQNPSALYQNWKTAQDNLKDSDPNNDYTPTLPDFSFAGYHHGEDALPSSFTQDVYDVTDPAYGAVANDTISDKAAIKKAIAAAEANSNGGIVFFPPGRFVVNDSLVDNLSEAIRISKSNIVIKGSGSGEGGTELYQKHNTTHADMATKDWVCPYLFLFWNGEDSANTKITDVTGDAERETYSVEVASASGITVGQWIELYVKNTDTTFVNEELSPYTKDSLYGPTNLDIVNKGVEVREIHKVVAINGNTITFKEPIHRAIKATYNWQINNFKALEEVGVQDLKYTGGFIWKHLHHRAPQELYPGEAKSGPHAYLSSSGWSGIQFDHVVNGWITNVEFSDMSQVADFKFSAYCSALNNKYTGNAGHTFFNANSSTGCLIGRNIDSTTDGIWHGCGLSAISIGNVLWRNENPQNGNSGMDSHASQPRANLYDACKGGFFINMGGNVKALPNHLKYLVLWNFEGTSYQSTDVRSWRPNNDTKYGKVIMPIISGLKGFTMSTEANQYQVNESPGTHVDEESLYETQLNYRLGTLPSWVATPTNLTASEITPTSVKLTWDASIGNETKYQVFDGTTLLTDSNFSETTFTPNALVPETSHTFYVKTIYSGTVSDAASVTAVTLEAGKIETFENSLADTSWGPDSFVGDNNVTWNTSEGVKQTSGIYLNSGKNIYMEGKRKNNGIGAEITSSTIHGGIIGLSIECKNLWPNNVDRIIEVLINGTSVHTSTPSTHGNIYAVVVPTLDITGDFTITIRNISDDTAGNSIAIDNIAWTPKDLTPPEITLLGSQTVNLTIGDTYSDAGATADDNLDGDITTEIVTVNPVDTNKAGTYTVTYNVSDISGNAATQVARTVIVSEKTYNETFVNSAGSEAWGPATITGYMNGLTWTSSDGVKQSNLNYMDGKFIYVQGKKANGGIGGEITSSTLSDGISALSFDCKNLYETEGRQIEVLINGNLKYTSPVNSTQNVLYTVTVPSSVLNISGDYTITIRNISPVTSVGAPVGIDNISWTTYTSGSSAKGSGSKTHKAINDQNPVALSKTIVAPNPFSTYIIVKLSQEFNEAVLFDVAGRTVFKQNISGEKEFVLTPKSLNSKGMYFLQLIGANTVETHKLIHK